MKRFSTLPILFVLLATSLVAQPYIEEERPLVRAVRSARTLIDNESYGRAIIELESAIDSAATGEHLADALYLLSRANFESQRYRPALVTGRRFLNDYPTDPRSTEILYLLGTAAYQEGSIDEARNAFTIVAASDEENRYEAYYWIARTHADRNHLDTAEIYALRSLDGPSHQFTDDALYLVAWIKEGRDAIDTAATLYKRVLDEYPESDMQLDAQLRLGVLDARRGNYESAIRLLNSFTPRSDRQREEQLFYLGEMSAALGRYDEALRYTTEFLREFPKSGRVRQARYSQGWAQLNLQRYDEAIATFRQLENAVDSIAAASAYQIGAIQMTRGDTANALRTFQALLYKLPYESFSDNAYYQLGRIFYRRGSYDSSRHYLLIAARQFPESELRAESYYLLGESYSGLNDVGNAQYAFARSQKVGATGDLYRSALYREGVMLYKVGRFRSGIDRFREYVSEHQNGKEIADATFWLGEALYQDRTYDESERYYSFYLERFNTGHWREQALYGLAWSRFQQKDFKGSALAFSDFIKNNPQSPLAIEATIRLADSYRLMGQYDRAVEIYESLGRDVAKGPRAEEARFRLADVFLQMGNVDRAIETFRSMIRDYPNSPLRDAYAFNIGSIYHEREKDSLAIAELAPFPSTYPNSQLLPQVAFTVGNAYYNLEQFDSALYYYRRVLDEYPNSVIVPEALDAVRFTLEAMDRGREAVAIIDTFQMRNPSRIPADSLALRKGNIILEQGDYPEAIAVFSRLVAEYPQSSVAPAALFNVGRGYEYMGNRDSAIYYYRRVIDDYPTTEAASDALIEGAGLKLRAGAWSQAANDYTTFIERYGESDRLDEARFGIASARLAMNDTAGALTYFEMVLDSTNGDEEDLFLDRSRIETARIIAPRGEADRALEILAAVVARRLDDVAAEALLLRSEILVGAKDLSGALAELRRLTIEFASFPEFAEPGMLLLGSVYEQLTNYGAAREMYTQLIAQTEDEEMRAEAEARLRALKK